jgi:GNAT superfamily N-acetyltransferase
MICLHPFRNDDPPAIAEIWRSQPAQRGLVQPMTEVILDEMVLCKPYFDRHGLLLAELDGQPVGFAQATCGPIDDAAATPLRAGTISMIMVKPIPSNAAVGTALLEGCEAYLRGAGATVVYGGEIGRTAPFYLGLYGGSVPPGILVSDAFQTRLYQQHGYQAHNRRRILERRLVGFRPVVDREMMQFRRRYKVERGVAATPQDWFSACTWGQLDVVCYDLKAGEQVLGRLAFWDIEPLASTWGVHAMGLLTWEADAAADRYVLLTYLLGESLRSMQTQGITLVEVQADEQDSALIEAGQRLGFAHVDEGIRYRRLLNNVS